MEIFTGSIAAPSSQGRGAIAVRLFNVVASNAALIKRGTFVREQGGYIKSTPSRVGIGCELDVPPEFKALFERRPAQPVRGLAGPEPCQYQVQLRGDLIFDGFLDFAGVHVREVAFGVALPIALKWLEEGGLPRFIGVVMNKAWPALGVFQELDRVEEVTMYIFGWDLPFSDHVVV
jgi:hypothetical protein